MEEERAAVRKEKEFTLKRDKDELLLESFHFFISAWDPLDWQFGIRYVVDNKPI